MSSSKKVKTHPPRWTDTDGSMLGVFAYRIKGCSRENARERFGHLFETAERTSDYYKWHDKPKQGALTIWPEIGRCFKSVERWDISAIPEGVIGIKNDKSVQGKLYTSGSQNLHFTIEHVVDETPLPILISGAQQPYKCPYCLNEPSRKENARDCIKERWYLETATYQSMTSKSKTHVANIYRLRIRACTTPPHCLYIEYELIPYDYPAHRCPYCHTPVSGEVPESWTTCKGCKNRLPGKSVRESDGQIG